MSDWNIPWFPWLLKGKTCFNPYLCGLFATSSWNQRLLVSVTKQYSRIHLRNSNVLSRRLLKLTKKKENARIVSAVGCLPDPFVRPSCNIPLLNILCSQDRNQAGTRQEASFLMDSPHNAWRCSLSCWGRKVINSQLWILCIVLLTIQARCAYWYNNISSSTGITSHFLFGVEAHSTRGISWPSIISSVKSLKESWEGHRPYYRNA